MTRGYVAYIRGGRRLEEVAVDEEGAAEVKALVHETFAIPIRRPRRLTKR